MYALLPCSIGIIENCLVGGPSTIDTNHDNQRAPHHPSKGCIWPDMQTNGSFTRHKYCPCETGKPISSSCALSINLFVSRMVFLLASAIESMMKARLDQLREFILMLRSEICYVRDTIYQYKYLYSYNYCCNVYGYECLFSFLCD